MEQGKDINEFRKRLELIDSAFFDRKIIGSEIEIWSFLGKENDSFYFQMHRKVCDTGKRFKLRHNKEEIEKILSPQFAKVSILRFSEDELDEIIRAGIILIYKKDVMIIEQSAIKTFAKCLGVGGDYIDISSIYRNEYLAHQLYLNACTPLHLLGRGKRVMAVMKENYKPIPQINLLEVAKIGSFSHYTITEHETCMYLTFPDIKEKLECEYPIYNINPGICVRIGNFGDTALIAQEIYIVNGGIISGEKVSAKHTKNFSIEKFIENIRTEIFPRYKRFYATYYSRTKIMLYQEQVLEVYDKVLKMPMGKSIYDKQFIPNVRLDNICTASEAIEAAIKASNDLEVADYVRPKISTAFLELLKNIDLEAV